MSNKKENQRVAVANAINSELECGFAYCGCTECNRKIDRVINAVNNPSVETGVKIDGLY